MVEVVGIEIMDQRLNAAVCHELIQPLAVEQSARTTTAQLVGVVLADHAAVVADTGAVGVRGRKQEELDVHQRVRRNDHDIGFDRLGPAAGVDVRDAGRLAVAVDIDLVDVATAGGSRTCRWPAPPACASRARSPWPRPHSRTACRSRSRDSSRACSRPGPCTTRREWRPVAGRGDTRDRSTRR